MAENLFYPLLALIPALLNVGIVVYIFFFLPKGRTTDVFTFFVVALILWQVEDTVLRLTTSEDTAVFWDRILSVGWLSLGPLFFHFAARYAGVKILYSRAALIAVYLPFIIFYLLYLANNKAFVVTQHEAWGWVFSPRPGSLDAVQRYVISFAVLAGVFILFRHAYTLRKNKRKRTKALLIAIGTFIPAAQGILTQVVFPLILNREEIPLTSTFLTFFSIAAIIALGKYRLFNLSESVEVDTVLENLTNVVIIISPDHRLMYLNPFARRVFGINENKDDSLQLRSIFPGEGEVYEKFKSEVLGSNAMTPTKNYATTFLSAKGEVMEVLVSTEIISNNKQVQGLLLVANDITERLKTLKELEASNERFEYVTQATFDAIWDWDLTTDTVYWGKGLENLFGHSVEELQKSHTSWIENIHPEDRERVLEKVDFTVRSKKRNWSDEYRFRKANGEYAYVADKGLVIRKDGQPVRMIGAMQDVTISKEQVNEIFRMQQNLNSLINNTTDLIWSIDQDLRIITANKSFKTTVENLTGKTVNEGDDILDGFYDEELKDRWRERYKRALGGEGFNVEESVHDPVSDRTMHSIISFNPIMDTSGNISGVACFAKDVTKLKTSKQKQQELNIALQKRAEELAASNTELEHFAYVASHDLQEPLRMVSSFLELLEKKYNHQLDDTAKTYISFATNGAAQMKKLILDLLEYSRVGTLKEDNADTDMNEVVQTVLEILKNKIREADAVVEVENLPVLPNTSKTQMLQLMQNLLSNALKYHGEEKPKVKICAAREDGQWVFSVKDNGIGIDPKFQEKVFIIFQRLHNKKEYSGTGIGLSICKKIVERHGGKIWVESGSGEGSTFYFSISNAKPFSAN